MAAPLNHLLYSFSVACYIGMGTSCAVLPTISSSSATSETVAEAELNSEEVVTQAAPSESLIEESAAAASEPASPSSYQQAIDRASSAFNISQSAQSKDDWSLAATRWEQALSLMRSVPNTDANYAEAQQKISEYQRNLTYAQTRASQPTVSATAPVITIRPSTSSSSVELEPNSQSRSVNLPSATSTNAPSASDSSTQIYEAPIIARAGGTPVISVVFNDQQAFPMIVDTGASGTLITPEMADALDIKPTGETTVSTASARSVSLATGMVQSIQVEGVQVQNVRVTISGPELDIGLLGHDFFGSYDVTIREQTVEFQER